MVNIGISCAEPCATTEEVLRNKNKKKRKRSLTVHFVRMEIFFRTHGRVNFEPCYMEFVYEKTMQETLQYTSVY